MATKIVGGIASAVTLGLAVNVLCPYCEDISGVSVVYTIQEEDDDE